MYDKNKKDAWQKSVFNSGINYSNNFYDNSLLHDCICIIGKRCFYDNLDCVHSSREDVFEFGLRCKELGIQYVGLCCGNSAHYTRALSEALGRNPPASRYTVNMNDHYLFGKSEKICERYSVKVKDVHQNVAGKGSD